MTPPNAPAADAGWDAEADFVIVGAGTAGCVLANRLSADPAHRVALIEAGGPDRHPYVRMPMGFLKALQNPPLTWQFQKLERGSSDISQHPSRFQRDPPILVVGRTCSLT